ncbi:MAG TPA: NAD(P)H oxidoreductase, partial [Persephonella sp.]|nr:NAD(P)H oxidoreductase [Persephonella sp.]
MKVLIVFAHPNNKDSFNKSILNSTVNFLSKEKIDFDLIDLYAEKFNPVLEYDELYKGKIEEKVISYQ